MKRFRIQVAEERAVSTPVHDGPLFSAICKVVGHNAGSAQPHVLTFFRDSAADIERFERDRQDTTRCFKIGDEVAIEFSKIEVMGLAKHMLVMSVNGSVRQEWGLLIGEIGSLVVQWRSRGGSAVLDCVPCNEDADLSQYGGFLTLSPMKVGERVIFSVIGDVSEPEVQSGFDWSNLGK